MEKKCSRSLDHVTLLDYCMMDMTLPCSCTFKRNQNEHFTKRKYSTDAHTRFFFIIIQYGNKLMCYILNGAMRFSWAGKMQTVPLYAEGTVNLAYGWAASWSTASEAPRWRFRGKSHRVPRSKSLYLPYPETVRDLTELLELDISSEKKKVEIGFPKNKTKHVA